MADFSDALGAMKRGLRVRREGWAKYGLSLAIFDGELVSLNKIDERYRPLKIFEVADMLATDWEHIPDDLS